MFKNNRILSIVKSAFHNPLTEMIQEALIDQHSRVHHILRHEIESKNWRTVMTMKTLFLMGIYTPVVRFKLVNEIGHVMTLSSFIQYTTISWIALAIWQTFYLPVKRDGIFAKDLLQISLWQSSFFTTDNKRSQQFGQSCWGIVNGIVTAIHYPVGSKHLDDIFGHLSKLAICNLTSRWTSGRAWILFVEVESKLHHEPRQFGVDIWTLGKFRHVLQPCLIDFWLGGDVDRSTIMIQY